MAIFLYAWELGGGLGHMLPFRPIAHALISNGHRVVAAVRDLAHVEQAFGELPVEFLPAPHKTWRTGDRIEPLRSFAHILHNTGWSQTSDLRILTRAWRTILVTVRPDAVICDHCPALLLALRGRGVKHATIGTGFCIPPDETPFPRFSFGNDVDPQKTSLAETHVLQVANGVLAEFRQPPLERLAKLYTDADDQILTTLAGLDHYPQRTSAQYVGSWSSGAGQPFNWPAGNGPRTFAYFKDFPALIATVKYLHDRAWPTVIFAPGLVEKLWPFVSSSLHVTDMPLNIQQISREADVVTHHGTHGMLAELLLAGKPSLSVPLVVEQAILAERVTRLGAGLVAPNNNATAIQSSIHALLQYGRYGEAADQFAEMHKHFDPNKALSGVIGRIERMAG